MTTCYSGHTVGGPYPGRFLVMQLPSSLWFSARGERGQYVWSEELKGFEWFEAKSQENNVENAIREVIDRAMLHADRVTAIEIKSATGHMTKEQLNLVIAGLIDSKQTPAPSRADVMMEFAKFAAESPLTHDPLYLGMLVGQFIMGGDK